MGARETIRRQRLARFRRIGERHEDPLRRRTGTDFEHFSDVEPDWRFLGHERSGAEHPEQRSRDTNQDNFKTYAAGVPATIAKYGGRSLVRGGKTQPLEGEPPKTIVVLAFDSAEAARKWYDSPEYSAIKPIRLRSAKARGFIVEGVSE